MAFEHRTPGTHLHCEGFDAFGTKPSSLPFASRNRISSPARAQFLFEGEENQNKPKIYLKIGEKPRNCKANCFGFFSVEVCFLWKMWLGLPPNDFFLVLPARKNKKKKAIFCRAPGSRSTLPRQRPLGCSGVKWETWMSNCVATVLRISTAGGKTVSLEK